METGDAYHVDVQQKVPLGLDREHVPPAYLRHLRALVLNAVHHVLPEDQATSTWVKEALGTKDIAPEAVRTVIKHRFGEMAVVYDPSDPEANKAAVVEGYTVIHGRQLSAEEWLNVRTSGALLPAGQLFPTPKPFSGAGGRPPTVLEPEMWSPAERAMAALYQRLAPHLIGRQIRIRIVVEPDLKWLACYGPDGELHLNRGVLGRNFFAKGASEEALELLLHELGHEWVSDHLSSKYNDALTKIGARLALAVANDPDLLALSTVN